MSYPLLATRLLPRLGRKKIHHPIPDSIKGGVPTATRQQGWGRMLPPFLFSFSFRRREEIKIIDGTLPSLVLSRRIRMSNGGDGDY